MSTDELQPIDPELARALEPARETEPVSDARRKRLRRRLEAEIGDLETASPPRRRRWVVGIGIVAAAAAALFLALPRSVATDTGSAQSVSERRTVKTGGRSIAVLEPGSDISWAVDAAGANIDQSRGRVFYRVEPGEPFLVRTPTADVRVTGTSFEVEIVMNKQKERLKSISLGAVLATITVVTVYEGRVALANEHGTTEISAGQIAYADAAHPPAPTRSRVSADSVAPEAMREPQVRPSSDVVMVSDLRARVRELEAELETTRTAVEQDDDEISSEEHTAFLQKMYNPTQEQLREAAKNCELSFAVPAALASGGYLTEAKAEQLGLAPDEVTAMTQALDDARDRGRDRLEAIYVDATGDEAGAADLSVDAMRAEILNKAMADDLIESRQRVAKERAGMLDAPAPGEGSPVERYYRHELQQAADAYSSVSGSVGGDRAYEVLGTLRMSMANYSDCNDE